MTASQTTNPPRRAQRPRRDRAEHRVPVHQWTHNACQQVHASLVTIGGKQYCDLRKYLKGPSGHFPTAKGLTVPVDELEQLEIAVRRLRVALQGCAR